MKLDMKLVYVKILTKNDSIENKIGVAKEDSLHICLFNDKIK